MARGCKGICQYDRVSQPAWLLAAVFLLVSLPAAAEEFLDVNIEQAKSLYLVLKDANVRAKPEKIGRAHV